MLIYLLAQIRAGEIIIRVRYKKAIQRSNTKQIEDEYNIPIGVVEHSNFVILSGCSGGGKSSVLTELANRGYSVVPEPGRQIVKEQKAIKGNGLPWNNLDQFLELALSRYLYNFNSQEERSKFVFFDRGIIDSVQSKHIADSPFSRAAKKFRYHKKVFLVPPWKQIYKGDLERRHDFEDAVKEYESLIVNYRRFGYEVVNVPKNSVEERVNFILDQLS